MLFVMLSLDNFGLCVSEYSTWQVNVYILCYPSFSLNLYRSSLWIFAPRSISGILLQYHQLILNFFYCYFKMAGDNSLNRESWMQTFYLKINFQVHLNFCFNLYLFQFHTLEGKKARGREKIARDTKLWKTSPLTCKQRKKAKTSLFNLERK